MTTKAAKDHVTHHKGVTRTVQMSLLLAPCSVNESPDSVFDKWTRPHESLNAEQIHILYGRLRTDGMNLAQVRNVVQLICRSDACNRDEFTAVLKELDRRYALLADVHWEFNLLAQHYRGSITEQDAQFLFKAVYDGYKWQSLWDQFISTRGQTGTRIAWDEIELPLCAQLGSLEVADSDSEEEEDQDEIATSKGRDEEGERKRKRHKENVEEMERMRDHLTANHQAVKSKMGGDIAEELQRQQLMDQQKNEVGKLKQDELLRQQELAKAIAVDQEQRRLKEDQKLAEERLKNAEQLEEQAIIAAAKAEKMAKEAKSKAEKEAAEKAKKRALELARKEKENRLRHKLDTAINSRDVAQLEPAIAEVKKEKVPDCVEQLSVAQRLLAQLKAKSNLNSALVARQLQRLEKAMVEVKDGKFEEDLKQEMVQANGLLEKLRRLEDMKREVINLNQQMVAEIKSYKQPPLVVHQVMTATFLLLGSSEAQTRSWPSTQVLIGKTGKEGLKRRVGACDVVNIPIKVARRAKQLLDSHDIDSVREASQGCATFYAWAMCMVDERMSRPV